MSQTFHSKYHRANHMSLKNPNLPDAGWDPIASEEVPFSGDFWMAKDYAVHANYIKPATGTSVTVWSDKFNVSGDSEFAKTIIVDGYEYIYGADDDDYGLKVDNKIYAGGMDIAGNLIIDGNCYVTQEITASTGKFEEVSAQSATADVLYVTELLSAVSATFHNIDITATEASGFIITGEQPPPSNYYEIPNPLPEKAQSNLWLDKAGLMVDGWTILSGDVKMERKLGVSGDVTLSGNTSVNTLNATGTVDFDSTLNVDGATMLNTLNATGAVDFDSTLNVDGATTLSGTLGVTGATTLSTLNATGAVDFDSTLNVDGATTLSGTLGVTGATTLSTLNATGAVDFDSTLNVDGATTLSGTLGVTGATTLNTLNATGAVDFDSTLNVDGATTLNTLHATGAVDFDSTLNVDGATTFGNTLNVTGKTTLSDELRVVKSITTEKNLYVTGNAKVGAFGSFGTYVSAAGSDSNGYGLIIDKNGKINGNTYIGGTLSVTGSADFDSTLNVDGATTLNSLGVTNNATVGGTFGVTGATTLNGDTTVKANLTVEKNNKSTVFDGEKISRKDGTQTAVEFLFPSNGGTLVARQNTPLPPSGNIPMFDEYGNIVDSGNATTDFFDKANSASLAAPYESNHSPAYVVGDYVTHEGSLYKCKTDTSSPPGEWDDNKWDPVAVTDEMGGGGPHASTHATTGSDPITPDSIGALRKSSNGVSSLDWDSSNNLILSGSYLQIGDTAYDDGSVHTSNGQYQHTWQDATGIIAHLDDIPDVPIKAVKRNGTALTPDANGAVNVVVPTTASQVGAMPESYTGENIVLFEYGPTIATAVNSLNDGLSNIIASIAAAFSKSETYAAGDYCTYEGTLYKCVTAVSTPGAWTGDANWSKVTVADEMATIGYVDSKIGDINSVLDAINGEEI